MSSVLRTNDVEEKSRLDYWQSVCSKLIGSVELKDCDRSNFEAGIELSTVADIKIGHFTGVTQTLERRPTDLKSFDSDDYVVLLESSNRFVFEHGGHQRSGSGGLVFVDLTQPYYSHHPERLDVTNVFLPRKTFERFSSVARRASGLTIEPTQPAFAIIANFLQTLGQHGGRLDAATAERMTSIAYELIAAGIAERIGDAPTRSMSGAAILCRAQAFIGERLGVAGLDMGDVAKAIGVSIRRLHQIAADEGISLNDWMWDRRLQRAKATLADPAQRSMSILAVAFQCGFADQAHFSRRFRHAFGLPPTEFRTSVEIERALERLPGARGA